MARLSLDVLTVCVTVSSQIWFLSVSIAHAAASPRFYSTTHHNVCLYRDTSGREGKYNLRAPFTPSIHNFLLVIIKFRRRAALRTTDVCS